MNWFQRIGGRLGNAFLALGSRIGGDEWSLPRSRSLWDTIDRVYAQHYDAASTVRTRADWGTTTDTPYNDLKANLKTMIARSRQSHDNHGLSQNIDNVFCSNVVGLGIRPEPSVKDGDGELLPEANARLASGWERYNDQWDRTGKSTYYENQSLGLRVIINSGSVVRNTVRSVRGSHLPIANQFVEPDRLDWTRDWSSTTQADASPREQTQFGIVLDEYGAPVRFWVGGISTPFPADVMDIRFVRRRPHQYIGVPWKAPVLRHLWDLDNLLEDTFISSRIRAMIALWVNSVDQNKLLATRDSSNRLQWEPGRIMSTAHKPEVVESKDNLNETFDPLTRLISRFIAVGTGLSYQVLTRDLHGMNFASSRANILEDRRMFRSIQTWFVKEFCQPDWERFVFWMFAAGHMAPLTITDYRRDPWRWSQCHWQPPGWAWVDPAKDARAAIELRKNNMLTLAEHYGAQGKNWRSELAQIAVEKIYIADLEREHDVDMSVAAPAPGGPQQSDDIGERIEQALEEHSV
jgi:lambda family phage portal protein